MSLQWVSYKQVSKNVIDEICFFTWNSILNFSLEEEVAADWKLDSSSDVSSAKEKMLQQSENEKSVSRSSNIIVDEQTVHPNECLLHKWFQSIKIHYLDIF